MTNRAIVCALGVISIVLSADVARAHFVLLEPACYSEQGSQGTPLKSAPCGQADPGDPVVPTGEVTALVEGQVVMVRIEEMVTHPGHYRVAIAPDMDSLPDDPPVTPGSTACGSTVIDPSPSLPVLVDGALVHDSDLGGPQTIEVQLPPGFTCDRCVLQVIEFMSEHGLNDPGGCFYHHCADVTVTAGTPVTDGGGTGRPDASTTTPPSTDSGCGCRVATRGMPGSWVWAALALPLLVCFVRRRR